MPRPVVNTLRKPGVNFVTIFRDDSQVALPKTISSMVEKSAADSMNRMYEAAKKSDQNIL
jgi:ABC-type hemin transport system substrate-binding protein